MVKLRNTLFIITIIIIMNYLCMCIRIFLSYCNIPLLYNLFPYFIILNIMSGYIIKISNLVQWFKFGPQKILIYQIFIYPDFNIYKKILSQILKIK